MRMVKIKNRKGAKEIYCQGAPHDLTTTDQGQVNPTYSYSSKREDSNRRKQ
jgi:hypothetical protein